MSFIDNVSDAVSKVARDVAKGTNKVVETSKLSLTLIEKEDSLKAHYESIGKILADLGDADLYNKLDINRQINDIDELKGQIVELKIKISELKNTKKCPDCGANVSKNSAYCSVCGSKIN